MNYEAAAVAQQAVQRKRIAMICPVRNRTEKQSRSIEEHLSALEAQGYSVHYPPRDTEQVDATGGVVICRTNIAAIRQSDEVHVWWDATSSGSKFDLGVAMALHKPVFVINADDVTLPDLPKSFEHVILALHAEYQQNIA